MSHGLQLAWLTGGTATSISAAITSSYALMIKIRLHDKLTDGPEAGLAPLGQHLILITCRPPLDDEGPPIVREKLRG